MLRLLTACAVGNPGPATLQFRKQAAQLATCVRRQSVSPSRTEPTPLNKEVLTERVRVKKGAPSLRKNHHPGPPPQSKQDAQRARQNSVPPSPSKRQQASLSEQSRRNPKRGTCDEDLFQDQLSELLRFGDFPRKDVVILLPAPRDQDVIDSHVAAMRDHLSTHGLLGAAREWYRLMELGAVPYISDSDMSTLGDEFSYILRLGDHDGQIASLYSYNKALFDAARHFVIEAAARGNLRLLYCFQIELLRYMLPQTAVLTYDAFRKRAMAVAGINIRDSVSEDRVVRLRARLEGHEHTSLALAQVAAYTFLDRFGRPEILSLFGTSGKLSGDKFSQSMKQVIRAVFDGQINAGPLVQRFEANCAKVTIAGYAWHSAALHMLILALSSQGQGDKLAKLYQDILDGASGPDAYIAATTVNGPIRDYQVGEENIPITPRSFTSFLEAFARLNRPDLIMRMIEEDLPALFGETPQQVLQHGMVAIASLGSRRPGGRKQDEGVVEQVESIWKRLQAMGADGDAIVARMRLQTLGYLGQFDLFESTAMQLSNNLRLARNPDANIAILSQVFVFLVFRGRIADALKILSKMESIDYYDELRNLAAKDILTTAAFPPPYVSSADRKRLVSAVLPKLSHGHRSTGPNQGTIIRYLLEIDTPVETACAIIKKGASDVKREALYFAGLFRRLLHRPVVGRGKNRRKMLTPPITIEAALHILERYVPRDTMIVGNRFTSLWCKVYDAISTGSDLPLRDKHELAERLVDSFPITPTSKPLHRAFLTRAIISESLKHHGADGMPEVVHFWRRLENQFKAFDLHPELMPVVKAFVAHGLPDLALESVITASRSGELGRWSDETRNFLKSRHEWTSPAFEDLLFEAGLINRSGHLVPMPPDPPRGWFTSSEGGAEVEDDGSGEVAEVDDSEADEAEEAASEDME